MPIGKKQCGVCQELCWTQAKECSQGHPFVKGRAARPTTSEEREALRPPERKEAQPEVSQSAGDPKPSVLGAGRVTNLPSTRLDDVTVLPMRKGVIPDKTFGGGRPPARAQIVFAAAGEPAPIALDDLLDDDKIVAWALAVREAGHSMNPPQHYALSALDAMIRHQHGVCPEVRRASEFLYRGLSPEQCDAA